MAASRFDAFRVLIVPGLNGSGPGHWQTRWERLHPAFERVVQARWEAPDLALWSAQVGKELRRSSRPTLIVAHSFGCLATLHCAGDGMANVAGALLVAPADPRKFGVERRLTGAALACPSLVVGSTNDPWMESRRAAAWAGHWGCGFISLGALGHINADSGLGDWPAGLALLEELARTAAIPIAPDREDTVTGL